MRDGDSGALLAPQGESDLLALSDSAERTKLLSVLANMGDALLAVDQGLGAEKANKFNVELERSPLSASSGWAALRVGPFVVFYRELRPEERRPDLVGSDLIAKISSLANLIERSVSS
jgi:hypothetical protein